MWSVWCLVATWLPVITLLSFCTSFEVWRWVGWDNTVTIVRSCLHLKLSWKKQLCLTINPTLLPKSNNVKFTWRLCLFVCQAVSAPTFLACILLLKFNVKGFHWEKAGSEKFGQYQTRVSGTLHEDVIHICAHMECQSILSIKVFRTKFAEDTDAQISLQVRFSVTIKYFQLI